jgi:nitrogen fixation protein NifU and related proteins
MSDLEALYRELLLAHGKKPRNFGALAAPSHRARADNPVCGDQIEISVLVREGRIAAVGLEGAGCALSMASASLMSVAVSGKTPAEVDDLSARFSTLLHGDGDGAGRLADLADLGDLGAFAGVARFPVRIACARLPWTALAAALAEGGL